MAQMSYYTEEEALNKVLGEKGNPLRDDYEANMQSFLMGEAIKKARQSKNMTQEQLGELLGVKRAQISRIERGQNLTLATISKVFKAMNITVSLDLGACGRIALS